VNLTKRPARLPDFSAEALSGKAGIFPTRTESAIDRLAASRDFGMTPPGGQA
jgi:hypothetical protein